ncbi:hypothetical protein [Anaerobiospirillum thomasii]|uniref:Uncharacterized protein n=1 Tax=Anaerobiospirillum thomasii TaxID=179995 RepID=A0A2X0XNA7_9GAMM|nr:hypothetical protein [Anaerobiospirillum thomasii]SPT78911.1 Uncharacterised protein [Anaerobiospirillum thomasii]
MAIHKNVIKMPVAPDFFSFLGATGLALPRVLVASGVFCGSFISFSVISIRADKLPLHGASSGGTLPSMRLNTFISPFK